LGYGQSSSVLLYLYEHKMLRKFYDRYKSNFEKDPTGKQTLEKITGKSLTEFEQDWIKWMTSRTPPAMDTGPNGVFVGISFAQNNDGLKIEQVLVKGPADQAGGAFD